MKYWKRRSVFALGLVSVLCAYRTFLISGIAWHGIWRRELHRCVRIGKLLSLDLNFARFGVRKRPKSDSNRRGVRNPSWCPDGFFSIFGGCSREPTARAVGQSARANFMLSGWLTFVLILAVGCFIYSFQTRFLHRLQNSEISLSHSKLHLSLWFLHH